MEGRIEELLGGFGIEAPDEFRRVFEVGKQHRHKLALACQRGACGENFLHEIGRRVGQRGLDAGGTGGVSRRRRRDGSSAAPDQHRPLLIRRQTLTVDKFNLEVLERLVIELEVPFEGAVGHTTALAQEGYRLIDHCDKVHVLPSLPGAWSPCSCTMPS
jgi:hypothetical protein